MGLFDSVLGKPRTSAIRLGASESFAAIALLAVSADGHVSDDELRALRSSLWRLKMFRSYSERELFTVIDRLTGLIRSEGTESVLYAAMIGLPKPLRETVFAITADLVLVDGEITPGEEDLLQSLYKALGIPKSLALQIVDVMVIKNKG